MPLGVFSACVFSYALCSCSFGALKHCVALVKCAFAVMESSPERDENGLNKEKRKSGGCNQRQEQAKKKQKANLYQSEVAKFMVPKFHHLYMPPPIPP